MHSGPHCAAVRTPLRLVALIALLLLPAPVSAQGYPDGFPYDAFVANEAIARVQESGVAVALDAMNPFERKVVHDAVAAAGMSSDSDGVEPNRHVVIRPA